MTMRRKRSRSLEGSVYAEALLLIPIFLAIWGAVMLIYDAHSAAISTTAKSRNDALTAATRGCDSLPAGCTVDDADILPAVPPELAESVNGAGVRRVTCRSTGSHGGGTVERGYRMLCMEDPGSGPSFSPTDVAPSLR